MDKVILLFSEKLSSMLRDYENKLLNLPQWKINSLLPNELVDQTTEQKIRFLVEKFKSSNPIYSIVNNDKFKLQKGISVDSVSELKVFNLDPRFLEGMGFSESQIEEFFKFVEQARRLLTV